MKKRTRRRRPAASPGAGKPACPACRTPLVGGSAAPTCPACPIPFALPDDRRPLAITLTDRGGKGVSHGG